MTTLQEYLNQQSPTPENKEAIQEINLAKISEAREKEGITELLEGGELDLREFKNLETVIIGANFLKTPLTKIEVSGLTNLKELILPSEPIETEAEKKLWEELGISEKTTENISQKKVIQEVNRIVRIFAQADSEKINIHFATEKTPQEKLGEKEGITIIPENKEEGYNIYLNLERKDKQGNFSPSLIFWTLARELTLINHANYEKDPLFWTNFEKELNSVKQNLAPEYFQELEALTVPSLFPTEQLEMSELLTVYYPNSESKAEFVSKITKAGKGIIDNTWKTIWEKLIELTSQEIAKNPSEEKLAELAIKATINYNSSEQEYKIEVFFHPQNPFIKELEELITTTPLKLEIEHLKQKQEQLPTSENFDKAIQEKEFLKDTLRDYTDEGEYNEILKKLEKFN